MWSGDRRYLTYTFWKRVRVSEQRERKRETMREKGREREKRGGGVLGCFERKSFSSLTALEACQRL